MKFLIVIDPIDTLNVIHDSSIGMMKAIQNQGSQVHICTTSDLFIDNAKAYTQATQINIDTQSSCWYHTLKTHKANLTEFDVILMRKDPPFNMQYVYTTYILDIAANGGTLVSNNPTSLRNFNEKLILNHFPDLTTQYCVSSNHQTIQDFLHTHRDCVIKALDSMGGQAIFRIKHNTDYMPILNRATEQQQRHVMIMPYIPEVTIGDKRLLIINGKACPYGLLRTPPKGQLQANIAAGGTGTVMELTDDEHTICKKIAPFCVNNGLDLVGVDVIGQHVTEINITSPTCLREIEDHTGSRLCEEYIHGLSEATCGKSIQGQSEPDQILS